MENNYIEHEVLGNFVDKLIAQKYPDQPLENFADFREKSIASIDKAIDKAIFGSLNREQLAEINEILDRGEENPQVFGDFFKKCGVDTEQKTTEVLENFKTQFLGGSNE